MEVAGLDSQQVAVVVVEIHLMPRAWAVGRGEGRREGFRRVSRSKLGKTETVNSEVRAVGEQGRCPRLVRGRHSGRSFFSVGVLRLGMHTSRPHVCEPSIDRAGSSLQASVMFTATQVSRTIHTWTSIEPESKSWVLLYIDLRI